jgi:hypothetical protein
VTLITGLNDPSHRCRRIRNLSSFPEARHDRYEDQPHSRPQRLKRNGRPLLTHRFKLADINEAYKLFAERRDGVMKVVITP